MYTQEIECRFLEIDKDGLIRKLHDLGAIDKGEELLEETIIYDPEGRWKDAHQFIRIRKSGDAIRLTLKQHREHGVGGAYEIEFGIDDMAKAEAFFEQIGLPPYRRQQKKRHTFLLDTVTVDIDTWPRIPAYVELEGESEAALKGVAEKLGLDWRDVDLHNARWVIENKYHIPIADLTWFTFDKYE
jgi:adenylate cyclase, class 2